MQYQSPVPYLKQSIRNYFNSQYEGGLVDVKNFAEYLKADAGFLLVALKEMEQEKQVEIVTRHFCPDTHYIRNLQNEDGISIYCDECDYNYSLFVVSELVYVKPL